jgi:hypothetical protein
MSKVKYRVREYNPTSAQQGGGNGNTPGGELEG